MIRLSLILSIIGIALICVLAQKEQYYSDQYDNIDPKSILENDKLREQYHKCFMGTGPCVTADAKFFKDIFSEAVVTKCKKCTEKQKQNMDIIVDWYTKNNPAQWNAVVEKSVNEMKKKNSG